MAKSNQNRSRQAWTDAKRREHLRGLALLDGDCKAYETFSAAQGEKVAERTLRHWRDVSHPELYEELRRELLGADTEAIVRDCKRLEFMGLSAQRALLGNLARILADEEEREKLSPKVQAEIAHKIGIINQQHQETIARAQGRPTSVVQHVSTADVLREIQESREAFLESEATEIPPDELPAGETEP